MVVSRDDFQVDFPDYGVGILFTGDLWAWRTGHVHG